MPPGNADRARSSVDTRRGPWFKSPGIDSLQAGMLIGLLCTPANHGLFVVYLLQHGGRDAWIGVLLALAPALFIVAALVALSRIFPEKSLLEYLPVIVGRPLGLILRVVYLLYFIAGAVVTLRRTTDWLMDSFMPDTPVSATTVAYLAVCLYVTAQGVQVIARLNQWFMPILIVSGFMATVGTLPAKDYGLLLPVMGPGPGPALYAGLTATGIMGELCVMGMILPHVVNRKRLLKAGLLGGTFTAISAAGPVTGSIATLGIRQASNMVYPTYREWLIMSVARFVERTDLLVVHQWLAGTNIRLSLFLYAAATGMLEFTRHRRWQWWLWPALGLPVGLLSYLGFSDIILFDQFMQTIYLPAGWLLGVILPPLLWGLARLRRLGAKGGWAVAGYTNV